MLEHKFLWKVLKFLAQEYLKDDLELTKWQSPIHFLLLLSGKMRKYNSSWNRLIEDFGEKVTKTVKQTST